MISVKDLKKSYGQGTGAAEEVLHGVSFDLPETGFICILGRSGSGKTSLLNAMGGLDTFDSGAVEIDGTSITLSGYGEMERLRNENFGYVFQNYYLLPEHSAAYNVYLGLHSLDLDEREKLKRVESALRKVDMLRFRKRLVGELSGGQQQRIAIARAIAKSPKVVFADEPTGNLDEESTLSICSTLKSLSKTSLVVMVTHEERLADFFADRIIRIEEGRISDDSTQWERGSLVSADRNALFSGDYKDEAFSSDGLNIRVLSADSTVPADITLVIEDGRIIIKSDDDRLVMFSKSSEPPFIREGSRPKIDLNKIETASLPEEETERPPRKSGRSRGLGLKMLFSEMKTTASKKRLRDIATAQFIIILALVILLAISDIYTAAKVDPEEFITSDSHVLELSIDKGKNYNDKTSPSVSSYVPGILDHLDSNGLDYDLIPATNRQFMFNCDIMPQYESLSMSFEKYDLVDIERLDPSTIVYGRMPERYDEVVVDRWVIRNCTDRDGIVQNFIPDSEYMVGKRIYMNDRRRYNPTIVGICDSGEPSIYMSKAGMLSVSSHGLEAIPYSEFMSITGMTDLKPVAPGECVLIKGNANKYYMDKLGARSSLTNLMEFYFREAVDIDGYEYGISAPMIISDDEVGSLLRYAVETTTHFSLWCADKEDVKKALGEELPGEFKDVLLIETSDTYQDDYSSFMEKRSVLLQTRFVITAAVGLLCLVMLYVIQRFRVRDRMDMIAVYRMLGIPKGDSMGVFILESILITLKFAVPTVFTAWAAVTVLKLLDSDMLSISVPLWAPFVTVVLIVAAEVVVAVLAVLPLVGMPPAKLASKSDF